MEIWDLEPKIGKLKLKQFEPVKARLEELKRRRREILVETDKQARTRIK